MFRSCVQTFFSLCLSIHVPKEYERALKYVRTLLKNEPGNNQAIELEKLIDKALKKGKHGWG